MCWSLETIGVICLDSAIIPIIVLAFGTCFMIIFFIKDIANDLSGLNVSKASSRSFAPSTLQQSQQNDRELKVHFRNIVQSFEDVKELSNK